jgi:hypothetical protein
MKQLLKQEKREEWRPCLYLVTPFSYFWGLDVPRTLLDFMIKTRHYNALFEADLNHLEITHWNYKLLAESNRQYPRVVDFLLAEGKAAEAVTLARHHRNYRLAGGIYEKFNATKQAGNEYREGRLYEEALRCYRAIGDETGIARVFEKQNNLEEALKIWKRLGNRREITRLQKKADKKKGPGAQLTLLEGKKE